MELRQPCNFRPIILSEKISSSLIYRSNSIDDGYSQSAQWLREKAGIKSYLDLRHRNEFHPESKLDDYFKLMENPEKINNQQKTDTESSNHGYRYNLEFAYGNSSYLHSSAVFDFYCYLLDENKSVMKQIFIVMTNENNFPILISCSYGKDRTGVVVAMIMNLVDCDNQLIIDEYCKSEKLLGPIQEKLNKSVEEKKLHKDFSRCPLDAIQQFLAHLQNKYGSTKEYLKLCGLTDENIENIRNNIKRVEINQDF